MVAEVSSKISGEQEQRDLFESHRHRTFALAFYMTGNEIEAEKILENTFLTALQKERRPNAFSVDSALIEQLDKRFSLRQEHEPVEPSQAGLAGRNIRRDDLEAAVRVLPPDERLLFLLSDVEGYSAGLIARLLAIPEKQVLRGLICSRLRLRQILTEAAAHSSEAA